MVFKKCSTKIPPIGSIPACVTVDPYYSERLVEWIKDKANLKRVNKKDLTFIEYILENCEIKKLNYQTGDFVTFGESILIEAVFNDSGGKLSFELALK